MVIQQAEQLIVHHSDQKVEGCICCRRNAEKSRFLISNGSQIQRIGIGECLDGRKVEVLKSALGGNDNGLGCLASTGGFIDCIGFYGKAIRVPRLKLCKGNVQFGGVIIRRGCLLEQFHDCTKILVFGGQRFHAE